MMKSIFKFISIFIILMSFSTSGKAQSFAAPNKEFTFYLPIDKIQVKRGDSTSFTAILLKSKGFKKSKADVSVASTLPNGIQINFSENNAVFDQTIGRLYVSKDAKPGVISLVISAEMRYLKKGYFLTIEVN